MAELTTTYLGLKLRSPLVASSSPLTGHLDSLKALVDVGAAAVVLPSLFEEQLEHDALELDRMLETAAHAVGEATSFFPDLADYNTGPDHYLDLVTAAKDAVDVPVIASLNGTTPGGWARYARLLEEAGADAIELNVYSVAADPARSAADVEGDLLDLVAEVAGTVKVPVAVKLGPYWSSLAHLAPRLVAAGAGGLVLFNRFYQPDLDLETFAARPRLVLSTPEDLRLGLRWIALLSGRVRCSLAATSGVHDWHDAAKALLVGADVAMMASALLHHGPDQLARVEAGLQAWMDEEGYESVDQLRGSAAALTGPDPDAFERGNYLQTLASWSSTRPRS